MSILTCFPEFLFRKKRFNVSIFSKVFLGCLIFLFAQASMCFGQEYQEDYEAEPIIYVGENVQIYSEDEGFSKQIVNSVHGLENHKGFIQYTSKPAHLSREENLVHSSSEISLENIDEKRAEERKIAAEVKKFKENKKIFSQDVNPVPSSESIRSSDSKTKYYVSSNHHFPADQYLEKSDLLAKEGLRFIHGQKFTSYNNRSLNFCFSNVFSVRPPPIVC